MWHGYIKTSFLFPTPTVVVFVCLFVSTDHSIFTTQATTVLRKQRHVSAAFYKTMTFPTLKNYIFFLCVCGDYFNHHSAVTFEMRERRNAEPVSNRQL